MVYDSLNITYEKALQRVVKELEQAGYSKDKGKYRYSDILVNFDMINEMTTATFKVKGYDFLECVKNGYIFDLEALNQRRIDLVEELDKMPSRGKIEEFMSIGTYNAKEGKEMLKRIESLEKQINDIDKKVKESRKVKPSTA